MSDTIAWNDLALKLIAQAARAPSSHNTQPWLFRSGERCIDLLADRTRALPVNDPDDRELAISCGCALMNLRIAALDGNLQPSVALLPASEDADWLARLTLTERSGLPSPDAALSGFIERRRTYRKRFEDRQVDRPALEPLIAAAGLEGAWLHPLLTEDDRHQAAVLVAEGDAAQWANPSWRRELAAWMHPRRRGDGLTLPGLALPAAQLVVRSFDMGGGVGARDRELAEASPLLAVLGTDSDHPRDWLLAGQALQRVLLVACSGGLQASYLNQPIQIAALRPKLQNLVGGGFPQILLRLGYPAEPVPPSPRRTVADLIDVATTQDGDALGR